MDIKPDAQPTPRTGDWWCPECKEALPWNRVTFHERCDTCGTPVTVAGEGEVARLEHELAAKEAELLEANAKHRDEMARLDKAWAVTAEETAKKLAAANERADREYVMVKRTKGERDAERIARQEAERMYFEKGGQCETLKGRCAELTERLATVEAAIATVYGYLWHVNNATHIPLFLPEQAAYEARKVLRDLMTSEQRGEAINRVKTALAATKKEKS